MNTCARDFAPHEPRPSQFRDRAETVAGVLIRALFFLMVGSAVGAFLKLAVDTAATSYY